MSNFLLVNDDDNVAKVDIDELYEKEKNRNIQQLSIFNKILNRIHKRITMTSRNRSKDKHVWFQVPEFIFGQALYDKGDCIAYLVNNLQENVFGVQYLHPNTLFISWNDWVPQYVRSEFRKKTGNMMNEKGEITIIEDEKEQQEVTNERTKKEKMQYTSVKEYQPTGKFVYNPDFFDIIDQKTKN
jgi:hypothetical protein